MLRHKAAGRPHLPSLATPRKRSTCGVATGADEDLYNTPLHVGALFIILAVSTLACSFPMMAARLPSLRVPAYFFFVVRHFGTGVLIATAFVHLLPTAFILLGDPCLSGFWTDDYPAMPGAIALAGIFLVTVVEMVFHPSRRIRPTPAAENHCHLEATADREADAQDTTPPQEDSTVPLRAMGHLAGRSSSIGRSLSRIDQPGGPDQISPIDRQTVKIPPDLTVDEGNTDSSIDVLTPEQKHRKAVLQCVLLEVGILFHSVFIGITLSVSIGNEFIVILIAIAFHRKRVEWSLVIQYLVD